ncbi:unnamed protein product [Clonostachys rosea]|uniref:F-box domain-containing protein n=1 Tax=Bionectria ochroleuca TaxID=29856 RepID=A0ABY6U989_BIOOC|nr:unnamed protein product [Clonostachys rosea]
MATFPRLPEELIVEILSHLPYGSLENVAWTFSHPLTDIAISLLKSFLKFRRETNARLIDRLGPLETQPYSLLRQDELEEPDFLERLGFSPDTVLKLPPSNRLPNLDYLHLCGDFKWLKPLTGIIAKSTTSYYAGPAVRGSAYEDLISSADRVGVTLPPAFVKFFQDEELQRRIPSGGDSFWLEPGGLQKVPKSRDGGVGGYKIIFLCAQQESYLASLYIEPGRDGASCVLMEPGPGIGGCGHHQDEDEDGQNAHCPNITDQDRLDAKKAGVGIIDNACADFTLVGVDFETWLATACYDHALRYYIWDSAEPVFGLKEYVKREFYDRTA